MEKPVRAKKAVKNGVNGHDPLQPLTEVFKRSGFVILGEKMSKEEFEAFSVSQELLQMERESDGTVIIMPVHRASGKRELRVGTFVEMWRYQTQKGDAYGPSAGFDLPAGSTRSADAAWISDERMESTNPEEEENSFKGPVPDFVVEVRSGSDRIERVKEKMKSVWMKNGVRLAWLIDPYDEKAYLYREGEEEPEIVKGFSGKKLSGENVMPGFEFPLDAVMLKKKK